MTTSPPLILYAENDIEFLVQFKTAMEKVNPEFQVRFFPNGDALLVGLHELERSYKLLPNLIVLNDEIPEEDGIAIIRKIKKKEKYWQIPVIIFIPHEANKRKEAATKSGAKGILPKPTSVLEIEKMVMQLNDHWVKLFNQF